MKDQWKQIVLGMIANELDALSEQEEERLADGVRKMQTES